MSVGEARARAPRHTLARVVGVPGAVLMGLGSVLGTGIFVSIGIAAEVAGASLLLALALAAGVAALNGLASAELAAAHPVSGGTYEYAHQYLHPAFGRVAGWMFLCAKTASAATAALGLSGYLLGAFGFEAEAGLRGVAVGGVAGVTSLVAGGMQRSSRANGVIVGVTLAALLAFVAAGAAPLAAAGGAPFTPLLPPDGARGLLHATALMFVAYTGYGRIATLGEEVREPQRNIPRAIVATVALSLLLYCGVAAVAIAAVGADGLAAATRSHAAPLEAAARALGTPGLDRLLAVGAVSAMLSVLLNLVLGLSRVVLAMARRGDLPAAFGVVEPGRSSPRNAVLVTGATIAMVAALGSVRAAWSFSAFTVLVYYAITNLTALRLPADRRRFPRWVPACGLLGCLGLAFWIEREFWLLGIALALGGLALPFGTRALARRRR